MVQSIKNQVVLVTGAGRGLGASIAKAFAKNGAKVAVNYRNSKDKAEKLIDDLAKEDSGIKDRVIAVQGDVCDKDSVNYMLNSIHEKLGNVTTLVHNALADYQFNGDAREYIMDLKVSSIENQHKTAVIGALNVIQACVPDMEKAHFGRIITIGTNLFQNPVVPYHDYTSAKGALLSLTRTSAMDLGKKGITVNMVSGGLLRTTDASSATPESVFDLIAENTPIGSVTTPEELADVVLFFASEWSRAITGQNLIVDGGLVCG